MNEEYILEADGRVRYTYITDTSEFKNDEKFLIGEFYNTSVTYLNDKETAISHLEQQYKKTKEELDAEQMKLDNIKINDTIAGEVKDIIESIKDMMKQVDEIKDFSLNNYESNNPKKFTKMIKAAITLKESIKLKMDGIDKIVQLSNMKEETIPKIKLYTEQYEKIGRQLEQVKQL